nr:MAG TPA: GENERAL NEGATIVE REGULATOR OF TRANSCRIPTION, SIGNALING PROTEIN, NOT4 RING.8A [Caudoviricetes sp.]
MTKYVDIDAAKEAVRKAECNADYDGRRFDAEFIENALDFIPAADVAPVVHGRWIFTKRHLWYKDENGNIDEWRVDNGFHNGPECQICHTAFCEHCTPDWSTTECEIGHYYCSECAETSRDAHEDYCPNCGAKMDGGES